MQFYSLLYGSDGLRKSQWQVMLRSVVDCIRKMEIDSYFQSLRQPEANLRVVQVSYTDKLFQHRSLQLLAHPASIKPNVGFMFCWCLQNILVIFRLILLYQHTDFYRAMLCIRGICYGPVSVSVCLSVCLTQVGVLLKRQNIGSLKQRDTIAQGVSFSEAEDLREVRLASLHTGAPNAGGVGRNRRLSTNNRLYLDKKLSYRRGTARCVVSIEILPIATQQCRNYLYDKS